MWPRPESEIPGRAERLWPGRFVFVEIDFGDVFVMLAGELPHQRGFPDLSGTAYEQPLDGSALLPVFQVAVCFPFQHG